MTMKSFIVVLVALLLVSSLAYTQPRIDLPGFISRADVIVKNTSDTIPSTAAGAAGWYFVGNDNVSIGLTALDSVNIHFKIEYADSGYGAATGSSAKSVGHVSRARVVGEDTLYTKTVGFYGKTIRDARAAINLIPGGRYFRVIVTATNTDEQALKAGAYPYRLKVNVWR
jgi:hypothetical protein